MGKRLFFYIMLMLFVCLSCSPKRNDIQFFKENGMYFIESRIIKIKFDSLMRCNVYRKAENSLLSIIKDDNVPHYIVINDTIVNNFYVNEEKIDINNINNEFGQGKRLKVSGTAEGPGRSLIEKTILCDIYEKFPEAALLNVEYRNVNSTPNLFIEKEVNNSFKLDSSLVNKDSDKNSLWILQGGAYNARPDWILPVTDNFAFDNYQGPQIENDEIGGGLPVLDVWSRQTGFFIGSVREKPTLISLPAAVDENGFLNIGIEYNRDRIKFDKVYITIPMVLGVHGGDYYNGLRTYAKIMACKGFAMMKNEPSDPVYEAIWCGWGFGPGFETRKMTDMIPLVKELGFKVVTVDFGWFYDNGDFFPRDDTFPNLDEDMRKFVKTFHDNGFKIKLWLTPCVAGPVLQKEHPEWLLKDKDGKLVQFINYGSKIAYLCPALKEVQDYYRELIRKFIGDWGYDGFKMDQQLINAVPRCYNKDHNHENPGNSFESLPDLYKIIYEESVKIKPDAIVEVCPCGVFPSFYKMPYYNQPVSSDFKSQWQIRHRGKTIKALMGPHIAYYGDHVERYYKESNFASMIGVGGIPGTMFVSRPEDNVEFLRVKYPCYLSPERKKHFEKWLDIYRNNTLSNGEYLNLYDIAFDKPETHVVKKDNIMYYAFYAPEWDGDVEFRGLDDRDYIIYDYTNDEEIGKVNGNSKLKVHFENHLLVKAIPE
ncbi:alpha-galactosidase [candidate division KSB1 bacterium]|nr:alpha-galactosidase [candidate division KSB1 bacterium]